MRHGKSSWEHLVDDIDRPLNERGINGVHTVAGRLAAAGFIPEKAISSPAVRALHTAEMVIRITGMQQNSLSIVNGLYLADVTDIFKFIAATESSVRSLALFGHNPGFTDLANCFFKDGIDNLPTAGVVAVTFDTSAWSEISKDKVVDIYFDYPKKQI